MLANMSQSPYEEIGGQAAVEAVFEGFYDHVLTDDQFVGSFGGMDINELYTHQVQFIISVTGGQ